MYSYYFDRFSGQLLICQNLHSVAIAIVCLSKWKGRNDRDDFDLNLKSYER